MIQRMVFALFSILFGLSMLASPSQAHTTGENYVWIYVGEDRIIGQFELNVTDITEKLDLPLPESQEELLKALTDNADKVQEYLSSNFNIQAKGAPVNYQFGDVKISVEGVSFAQFAFETDTFEVPDEVTLTNSIFTGTDDRLHRSLLVLSEQAEFADIEETFEIVMVFGPQNPEQILNFEDPGRILSPRAFIWQGVLHVWFGYDHVLFIIALLLMSVMRVNRDQGANTAVPVDSFGPALWNVAKIVTIFTIAHSITLSLAALGYLNVPSRFVESVIALSILIVAMNNIFPKFNDKRWLILLFFGLFHGMGFASVMGDLPFRPHTLVKVLIGFNIGVELAQLAIVAVLFPVLYALRTTPVYRPIFLVGVSVIIGLISLYWLVERALNL